MLWEKNGLGAGIVASFAVNILSVVQEASGPLGDSQSLFVK